MSIEKTPVYTVPKFLKEYIKERNIESPDPLEEYRESMELDNYFQKCDNEEIYINFPQKDKAYELFSKALKKIKLEN